MTSSQRAIRQLLSFGVKYAPLAYEGLRHGQGPARQFAERQMSRRSARTVAMEHAAHLVHGSVLPVYDGDTRVWVVFSGDLPVATHPVVATPLDQLLTHYDLDKRRAVSAPVKRRHRPKKATGPVDGPTGTGWPQTGAPGASPAPETPHA